MMKIIYTIDVETDLHTNGNESIKTGLARFEKICDKHSIKPVLFIVASTIPKNKEVFKRLQKKGWEMSLHGYSHKRFDDMSYKEKEEEIQKSLQVFKKYLNTKPKGFRAPQHSIDDQTLDLLQKYGLEYDSSYTPFNALQLLFFPARIGQFLKQFFSKPNPYLIRRKLKEIPVPSLILPPVSLIVRVFPRWFLYIYFKTLISLYKSPVFYAHSWDFIRLPKSRIDRTFPHTKLLDKLDFVMSLENARNK